MARRKAVTLTGPNPTNGLSSFREEEACLPSPEQQAFVLTLSGKGAALGDKPGAGALSFLAKPGPLGQGPAGNRREA